MDQGQGAIREGAEVGAPSAYEAPRIETVMTPEDLAREVQYAGLTGTPIPP